MVIKIQGSPTAIVVGSRGVPRKVDESEEEETIARDAVTVDTCASRP